MSINVVPLIVFHLDTVSSTESLDELLADESFFEDLIALINQNFVTEIEVGHKIREEVETDLQTPGH